ncbi:MAG: hypothetical protein LBF89_12940 [Bacteroidales bacterium]|jgi:hypothetical protein|nr:hypothetical protein [Bacteroidales bacterium]
MRIEVVPLCAKVVQLYSEVAQLYSKVARLFTENGCLSVKNTSVFRKYQLHVCYRSWLFYDLYRHFFCFILKISGSKIKRRKIT